MEREPDASHVSTVYGDAYSAPGMIRFRTRR